MSRSSAWPLLLASLGLLVLAVMLLTAPSPAAVSGPSVFANGEILRGAVQEVERGASALNRPLVRLRVRADSGSVAGATLDVEEHAIGPTNVIREFKPGDRVLLSYTRNPNGTDNIYIVEYIRTPWLTWLAALFAVAIGLIGGFQGLRSLLGMAISFLVILRFIIPHILNGESPVLISVVGALAILVATLYLSHGLNAKTTAALAGTVIALLITGVLGEVFISATRMTGISEQVTYLTNQTGPLSFRGLLLAGLIIGTLGVLDDVAASQSSAVFELHAANPALGVGELFRRGMRVGRDHIASTVNTLFLAYAGSALPLLLLLSTRPEPLGTLLNRESITVEIVNALTGSIGLISAVPLTTIVAAAVVSRRSGKSPDGAGGNVGGLALPSPAHRADPSPVVTGEGSQHQP